MHHLERYSQEANMFARVLPPATPGGQMAARYAALLQEAKAQLSDHRSVDAIETLQRAKLVQTELITIVAGLVVERLPPLHQQQQQQQQQQHDAVMGPD